jgi:Fe-S oxidoreductase
MAGFDYGRYFGDIIPLADALRDSPRRFWEPTPQELAQPHEYVLYLGCNVLRTVHLAESIVAVLRELGVDFITLGGPSNCCGIVHHREGDLDASAHLTQHTMDKFAKVRPKAVLMYCPSCHSHFDSRLPEGDLQFDVPYLHVTEFIAARLADLPMRARVERRIGVHAHAGFPQQRADTEHTLAILRAIPGLEAVELPADEAWGRACTPKHIAVAGNDAFRARMDAMAALAREHGCDGIAAVYHSCYRELLPHEPHLGLELVNYVELLTQAMGLGPFAARFKALKLAQDPAAAYAELAPRARAHGANLERLRRSVQTHFAPAAAGPGDKTGPS